MPETLKENTADASAATAAVPAPTVEVGKARSLWSDAWHDLRRSRCSSSRLS